MAAAIVAIMWVTKDATLRSTSSGARLWKAQTDNIHVRR